MSPTTSQPDLRAHTGMLRRYLFVLGARTEHLDDLVQEVFVLALQKPPRDFGDGRLGAFLRAVGKHMLLRQRRSAAARREIELAADVWQQECRDGDGDARLGALHACVEQLPPRSRELLQRAYAEAPGRHALGAEFGLRADGVKTALRRLRAALRQCVERRLRGGT